MLGMMLMGSDASVGSQYFAGGVLHFGIIITGIAFFGMPIMASMLAGDGAANPCNPCSMHKVHNPCNPCSIVVVEEIDVMAVNPCALEREEEALAWEVLMVSFFNHFIFAFSLAFLYRMRKSKS